jgi:predicted ferric reductase
VTLTVRGIARCALWIGLYVLVVLFPVPWLALGRGGEGDFTRQLGAMLGYLALSILAVEGALTARFDVLAPPFGADVLYAFHRGMAAVAVAFALLHPLLMVGPARLLPALLGWSSGGEAAGALGLLGLLLLAATAALRRPLRLPYVGWRASHGLLAVAAVGLGLWHAASSGLLQHDAVTQAGLWVWTLGWLALLLRVRVAKPLLLLRRPYRVTGVRPEHGGAVTLVLDPENHNGLRFRAGQFAWVTLAGSPFLGRERPFSFSGSSQRAPQLQVTVQAVGEFTKSVQGVRPGLLAYVDGPFGAFSIDTFPDADRYFFVAGGIGVAPCVSMLRTLADRGDRRPHTLVYGSADWDSATFRDDLAELSSRLDLKVVHVLERPPLGWLGETGAVGRELLERHLPRSGRRVCFVCGPGAMMDVAERALAALEVPLEDIHAERLELA